MSDKTADRETHIMKSRLFIVAAAAAAAAVLLYGISDAAEIRVLSTQATEQAYRELAPRFEKEFGHKVTTIFTGTLDLQKRIAAGETYDLIIMAGPAIDDYIKAGKVVPGSRVDLAKSGVGVGVRAGAPKPDIGSTEALKKALLAAKSIGYSTGPSGVFIVTLFQRLGVADAVAPKLKQTPTGVFVGSIIANGEVEIGFQQVSELAHFDGVDFRRPAAAGGAADHRIFQRHPGRGEGDGRGQGAGEIPHRPGVGAGLPKPRPGAGLSERPGNDNDRIQARAIAGPGRVGRAAQAVAPVQAHGRLVTLRCRQRKTLPGRKVRQESIHRAQSVSFQALHFL